MSWKLLKMLIILFLWKAIMIQNLENNYNIGELQQPVFAGMQCEIVDRIETNKPKNNYVNNMKICEKLIYIL